MIALHNAAASSVTPPVHFSPIDDNLGLLALPPSPRNQTTGMISTKEAGESCAEVARPLFPQADMQLSASTLYPGKFTLGARQLIEEAKFPTYVNQSRSPFEFERQRNWKEAPPARPSTSHTVSEIHYPTLIVSRALTWPIDNIMLQSRRDREGNPEEMRKAIRNSPRKISSGR
jgi:hypothetical protein